MGRDPGAKWRRDWKAAEEDQAISAQAAEWIPIELGGGTNAHFSNGSNIHLLIRPHPLAVHFPKQIFAHTFSLCIN